MPSTPYRNWEYPLKGLKPYYIEIVDFYKAIDLDVNTLFNRLDNLSLSDIVPNVTSGNIFVANGTNYIPLPVGPDGYVLTADSTQVVNLRWAPSSGGGGGGDRQRKVISYVDNTAAPPTQITGDRYLLDFTGTSHVDWEGANGGDIVEYDGLAWVSTSPIEGYVVYVDDEDADRIYVNDGVPDWEFVPPAIFQVDTGLLSSKRIGTTNTVAGDYSFAVGQGNSIDTNSDYASVSGLNNTIATHANSVFYGTSNSSGGTGYNSLVGGQLNTSISRNSVHVGYNNSVTSQFINGILSGSENSIESMSDSLVTGYNNSIYDSDCSVIAGSSIGIEGEVRYSAIMGTGHSIGEQGEEVFPVSACGVFGSGHWLRSGCSYNLLSGYSNTCEVESSYNIISGRDNTLEADTSYNAVFGLNNYIDENSSSSIVSGAYNKILNESKYCLVTGYKASNSNSYTTIHSGGHPSNGTTGATAGEGQVITVSPSSGQTTNSTPKVLYLGGAVGTDTLGSTSGHALLLKTLVIAKCIGGSSSGGVRAWEFTTVLNNTSGTLSIIEDEIKTPLPHTSVANESSWDVNVSVSSNNYRIEVTGYAAETINWQAFTFGPEIGIS